MKKIVVLLVLGIIVSLAGCKLGPDFVRSEYEGPEYFRFNNETTDTIVNLRWWDMFDDDVLDTLIVHALKNNKNALVAAARVDAALANLGYTKADQWPSFGYSAGVNSGNLLAGAFPTDVQTNYLAFPQMSWEIGFWGKYRRLNESARASMIASEYGMRTVQIGLISAVASSYFMLLDNINKLNIAKKTLAARDSSMQIIQARYDYGVVPEIDLNNSQIQRAISAVAVPAYTRAVELNQNTLSILLGQYPDSVLIGRTLFDQPEPPQIPSGIPSQLLTRRPDVMQAEADYAAQNARIGAAQAMRWPALNLTGVLGVATSDLSALTTSGLSWTASGMFLGPIFNFGKNKRRVDIERANTEVALRNYEQTTLQAFKDVEDALITIQTVRQELEAQEARIHAAMNAEHLSAQRYDKGQTSYLEFLEAQRQSFDAQLSHSETRRNLLGAHIALYKALGGGWLSPEEEQAYLEAQQAEQNDQNTQN